MTVPKPDPRLRDLIMVSHHDIRRDAILKCAAVVRAQARDAKASEQRMLAKLEERITQMIYQSEGGMQ